MKIFSNFFEKLKALFPWLITSVAFKVVYVEDFPENYMKNVIYLVGDDDPWYAAMLCPCSCNEIIRLCLQEDVNPSWKLQVHKGQTVSLYPSVWRTSGCRSHFFIKRGYIDWCKSYDKYHVRRMLPSNNHKPNKL